jgi:hypothetical protein
MCPEWTEGIWRRRPDLNRGSRFCRPLPYHLATAPVGTECRGIPAASMRSNNNARNSRSEPSSNAVNVGLPSRRSRERLRRGGGGWSGKRDSNPRLRPWQGRTLPLSYSRSSTKSQRTTAIFAQSRRPAPRDPRWIVLHSAALCEHSPSPFSSSSLHRLRTPMKSG